MMEGKIPMVARRHVTNKLRNVYLRASKRDKAKILDGVMLTTGMARSPLDRCADLFDADDVSVSDAVNAQIINRVGCDVWPSGALKDFCRSASRAAGPSDLFLTTTFGAEPPRCGPGRMLNGPDWLSGQGGGLMSVLRYIRGFLLYNDKHDRHYSHDIRVAGFYRRVAP